MVATAACGSSGRTLARSYDNPALGLAIRYPANWLVSRPEADTVVVGTKAGWVNIEVGVVRSRGSFEDATKADFANLLMTPKDGPSRILHTGFVSIAGLRLAEVEYTEGITHYLWLSSKTSGGQTTSLGIRAVCPTKQWPAQRATETAILDSLKITKPKA